MKRFFYSSGVCVAIIALCFMAPAQAGAISVETASACTSIADREPLDAGNRFSVSVGKLYCFSKIADIQASTEIVHVWYYGETERARVSLGVNPPAWRTYSSKIIQAHEVGSWRVDILDASGNLLESVKFETTY
jgi:hypothetical protein